MKILENIEIPVVDFSCYSLERKDRPEETELLPLVADIENALNTCNAFFIKAHGIDPMLVDRIIDKGNNFFSLPLQVKSKYYLKDNVPHPFGYFDEMSQPSENVLDENGREAFLYVPYSGIDKTRYPDNNIAPGWMNAMDEYYLQAKELFFRLMDCISLLLGLERDFLCRTYLSRLKAGIVGDAQATLRLNQYPPMSSASGEKRLRLGAHADYTMLTLLYITEKGLLSELPDGSWLAVDPKPGCILVQAGFFMQNITKGRILQNRHCVVGPVSEMESQKYRHSVAYFGVPDFHSTLAPIPEVEAADGWEEMEKVYDRRPFGEITCELMNAYKKKGLIDAKHTVA